MAMNDVGIKITAQDATGAAFNSVGGKLGALKTQAAGIGDTVGALVGKFGALGLAISSAMSVASVKGAIDAADAFSKMAQKTGVTVEALRELNYAASLSDVSTEALGTGLKKLSQNMALAAGGSKLQGEAFKAMGLSVKDTSGSLKGADTMLTEIAAKFASFKDGPEKAALAINLFGKAGADMIPLLNAGATGLSDMAQEARDLGTVFGGDMAKNAEAFNDNLTRIGTASKSAFYSIATELLPTLNQLSQAFLDAQKSGTSFASSFGGGLNETLKAVSIGIAYISTGLKAIGLEMGGIVAKFSAMGEAGGVFTKAGRAAWSEVNKAVKEDLEVNRRALQKFQSDLYQSGTRARDLKYSERQGFGETLGSTQTSAPIVAQGVAATAKTISEASKGLALYNDLMDQGAGFEKTWAEDANKLRAALDGKTISQTQFNEAANALLQKQPVMVAAAKAQADAQKEITKELDASAAAQQKLVAASFSELENAQAAYEAHGKLASVLQEENLARLENSRLITAMAGEDTSALDVQIANKKKVIAALQGTELKNAADDLAKANQKAAEESGRYWEDALMRAFESGKGFFQSLWDTIKNTLKTQVLKVTVQGVMGTLGIGASGAAFAGGGGTDIFGLANTASSLSSLYSTGSSIISLGSQVAAGTMGVANALGTLAANATGTGISGLLATNAAYGTAAAGTAASAAGGLTAGLAAIPGWGWAALGAIAVASMFGGGGETRSGATYDNVGGTVRYQQGPSGGEIAGSDARRLFTVATDSITAALAAVGSQAKLTGFVAGLESSENGKGFDFAGGYIDGVGFGEYSGREGDKNGQFGLKSQSAEQAFANYATQLKQATVQALQAASDVPKTIKDMLSGIDANALTGEAVDTLLGNINAVVGMVNSFNQAVLTLPFENLKNLSFDAAAGLIAFSGGIEALGANLNTYYTNFYSAEEQRLQTIKNINAATAGSGLDAATATKESFRALVDAQDLATESGQKTYAALMAVAGTFAQVADAATAAADAASKAAQDAAQTASKLMIEVFEALQDNLTDLMDAIASERGSVAAAMLQVSNPGVMTKDAIQRGIAGTALMTPGSGGLSAAQISLGQADTNVAAQAAALAIVKAQTPSLTEAQKLATAKQDAILSTLNKSAAPQTIAPGMSSDALWESIIGPQWQWHVNRFGIGWNTGRTTDAERAGNMSFMVGQYDTQRDAANAPIQASAQAAYDAQMASYGNAAALTASQIAAAQAKLSEATAAQSAALVAAREAQSAYIASLQNFAIDATKAAAKLGTLREETLKYYEAQKQLADLMLTSAANLRGAADALRQSLLSPAELLAKQTNSFAQNYSMVLATSGATQASYADKLAALLPELANSITAVAQSQTEQVNSQLAAQTLGLEDRSATSAGYTAALTAMQVAAKTQIDAINAQSEASINQYIAQSEAAAAQLEANTPQNYAADTLAMLSQIDAALVVLDASAKSAEMVIADAIAAGADSTANGLRAVIAALTGNAVPAFASGGSFGGGLRLVGENGPELEVTGPSRIFNANQTSAMLGGSNAEMVQELRALRAEVAGLRAEAQATAGHTSKTARLLDRAMPDGDALATRVAT